MAKTTSECATTESYEDWKSACASQGYAGPFTVQASDMEQFVSSEKGTVALWNPKTRRGIFLFDVSPRQGQPKATEVRKVWAVTVTRDNVRLLGGVFTSEEKARNYVNKVFLLFNTEIEQLTLDEEKP